MESDPKSYDFKLRCVFNFFCEIKFLEDLGEEVMKKLFQLNPTKIFHKLCRGNSTPRAAGDPTQALSEVPGWMFQMCRSDRAPTKRSKKHQHRLTHMGVWERYGKVVT